jgi:hypothetical protein
VARARALTKRGDRAPEEWLEPGTRNRAKPIQAWRGPARRGAHDTVYCIFDDGERSTATVVEAPAVETRGEKATQAVAAACVLSPINRHQSPTEQAPKMPISTAQRVLTHILSQFSKATLTDPGFTVSVPIQHLCVKIDLADEPTTIMRSVIAWGDGAA